MSRRSILSRIGINPAMLAILNKYPVGNDPQSGADRGLNFGASVQRAADTQRPGLRRQDGLQPRHAGKHTLMFRGTLADNSRRRHVWHSSRVRMPRPRAWTIRRALAARYTAVVSPRIVNVFSYGFTRLGIVSRAVPPEIPCSSSAASRSIENFTARFGRVIPTTNFVNDTTWTKGQHTIQFGINFRLISERPDLLSKPFPATASAATRCGVLAPTSRRPLTDVMRRVTASAHSSSPKRRSWRNAIRQPLRHSQSV